MQILKKDCSRREFLKRNTLAGAGTILGLSAAKGVLAYGSSPKEFNLPVIIGGKPVRTKPWLAWPQWDSATMDEEILKVIRSGIWSRAKVTDQFEKAWAEKLGVKRCLAVINGTNALIAALVQFGIGGGDEVLVPPYTFIATVAAVLNTGAMPVFVDVDPETFQIDPEKIEAKISRRTKAIMPVHILGLPANMTRIMEIARKHHLIVLEDACQAHLAEINHQKVGTIGDAGCFSFQNSKHLPIGEGGAIVSNNDEFMDRCFSYNNFGNPFGSIVGEVGAGTLILGTKLRITEYQSAIGLLQMKMLQQQSDMRAENGAYLKSIIGEIPGIIPVRLYNDVTKAVFHLFPFRYDKEQFKGLSREKFIKALQAEGIPCSGGYAALNKMPYLRHAFQTKNFRKMYPKKMLDYEIYLAQNQCPNNDMLCSEQAVWIPQNVLLSSKTDMDDIFHAVEKIQVNAEMIKTKNL
jgi:dTDP-4-amino-4,6-dideoxygalactose transaminase